MIRWLQESRVLRYVRVSAFEGKFYAKITEKIISSIISNIVIWMLVGISSLAIVIIWRKNDTHPQAVAPSYANIPEPTSTLSIIDAVVKFRSVPWKFFGLAGGDTFYVFDVSIRNVDRVGKDRCTLSVSYALSNGGSGYGTPFVGLWTDWLNGKAASGFFSLSAEPTAIRSFFLNLDKIDPGLPISARGKIICTEPEMQVSPWRNIDISRLP